MKFKHAEFISFVDGKTTNIVVDENGNVDLCQEEVTEFADIGMEVNFNIDELALIVDIARKLLAEHKESESVMKYTYDDNTYSDLYKDVHGFRPRGGAGATWVRASAWEKQAMWDSLLERLEVIMEREKEVEKLNILHFEGTIKSLIMTGAGDRVTALRWLREADDVSMDDPEYFCFRHGLPYDYFSKGTKYEN